MGPPLFLPFFGEWAPRADGRGKVQDPPSLGKIRNELGRQNGFALTLPSGPVPRQTAKNGKNEPFPAPPLRFVET